MNRDHAHFLMLNIGHFMDHLLTLIFATVAALALAREWGMPYGDLAALRDARVLGLRRLRTALRAGWRIAGPVTG